MINVSVGHASLPPDCLGLISDDLQAFFYSLQLLPFLFGSRRVTSHFPPPAKQRLPFALLNLYIAIIISNEKSANGNLNSCFSVEINAGSS